MPANGMFLEEKMYLSRSGGRGKSEVPPTDAKIAKLLNRILWDRLFLLPFNTFFDLMRSKKAAAKKEEEGVSLFLRKRARRRNKGRQQRRRRDSEGRFFGSYLSFPSSSPTMACKNSSRGFAAEG